MSWSVLRRKTSGKPVFFWHFVIGRSCNTLLTFRFHWQVLVSRLPNWREGTGRTQGKETIPSIWACLCPEFTFRSSTLIVPSSATPLRNGYIGANFSVLAEFWSPFGPAREVLVESKPAKDRSCICPTFELHILSFRKMVAYSSFELFPPKSRHQDHQDPKLAEQLWEQSRTLNGMSSAKAAVTNRQPATSNEQENNLIDRYRTVNLAQLSSFSNAQAAPKLAKQQPMCGAGKCSAKNL